MAAQFRSTMLRLALPLFLSASAGCFGTDEGQPGPPATPVVTHPDTTLTPSAGAAAPEDTSLSVAPGSGPAVIGSDTVALTRGEALPLLDTLRMEIASLRQEIAAGNDTRGVPAAAADTSIDSSVVSLTGDRVRETAEGLRHIGLRSFWALILIGLAWLLVRFSVWLLELFAERTAARRLFFKKLIPIARLTIWSGVVWYIVSGVFQVDRSGLLTATAALGVGIGFAAQGVLKNFIGGLIVIFDQPFQVGDKISVGGTYGEVVSIGMRSTRIVTPDDSLVTVPNAQVVEEQVSNANAGALDCQVVVHLYLPGWVDVMKAKAIAHDAAANSQYVFLGKPIVVLVADEFKETFLTHLKVKSYVLDTRLEALLASDVTERAKAAFLEHGMLWPMAGQRRSFETADRGSGDTEG